MKTYKYLFSVIRKGIVLLFIVSTLFSVGCGDEALIGLPSQDNVPPGIPTVVKVENLNGAAIIYFEAPDDEDLLCVTASYTLKSGAEFKTKSSVYNNTLKVEGFGASGDYTVTLKSVDKSQNESVPVEVTVSPLDPPVKLIYESLNVESSFGGIKLKWDNADENNVIINVFTKDSLGDWIDLESFYTKAKDGLGTIRGMDTLPVQVGIRVRDRWDNYSEIMETIQTPIFEEELPKSRFRQVTALPNDAVPHNTSLISSRIWDGIWNSSDCYHTNSATGMGNFVTFDMGQLAKLSRFKMWQRQHNSSFYYSHNNLKHYIVYGATEITAEMRATGSLDGWHLLLDTYCHKPSGVDNPTITDEDIAYMKSGDEHEIPLEAPNVRYIRILMLENWSGGTIGQIAEMTFWGNIIESYY